jgi:hypothetical protein
MNLPGTRMWLLLHTCESFLKIHFNLCMYIQIQMLLVVQFLLHHLTNGEDQSDRLGLVALSLFSIQNFPGNLRLYTYWYKHLSL